MGFYPPANATMLAVGGNTTLMQGAHAFYTSGNSRVGGTATGLRVATQTQLQEDGLSYVAWGWAYDYKKPGAYNVSVKQHLGKTTALHVDTDGDGKLDMDYNGYTTKTLIPLSEQLAALPTTGTITYGNAPEVPNNGWQILGTNHNEPRDNPQSAWITITREGKITFTGDGQQHRQIFNLDVNKIDSYVSRFGYTGWSLDFENIPDGQAIIVNVTGKPSIQWNTGWRIWVNGQDYSTYINSSDASYSRFRSISSRIMWNYPQATSLRLREGYVAGLQTGGNTILDTINAARGVLFPGSILLPHGSLYDLADTNGRILVGKNLTFDIWEHHNAPWIGFDEPQCFTVSGNTTATLN